MVLMLAALALAAAPQGLSVQVAPLTAGTSDATNARTVEAAIVQELKGQGYSVIEGEAGKNATVRIEGTLARPGSGGALLTARLVKVKDGQVLSEEKAVVKDEHGFEAAGTSVARELAIELRHTFGMRVKVKF